MPAGIVSLPGNGSQPGGSVSSFGRINESYLNNLNDKSFGPHVYEMFETDRIYLDIMYGLPGSIVDETVRNRMFYHFERGTGTASSKIASNVPGTGAGNAVTIPIASSSHTDSGNSSPFIVEEIVYLATNREATGKVISKNTTTPNAHTVTILPINGYSFVSAGLALVSAGDILLSQGRLYAGEGAQGADSQVIKPFRVFNTVSTHRKDYKASNYALNEKHEYEMNGSSYLLEQIIYDGNKEYLKEQAMSMFFGEQVAGLSNGDTGSRGIIPTVKQSGININYNASSMTIEDIRTLARQLKFYGGPTEYHWLIDTYQREQTDELLRGKYQNGAISYGSFNDKSEVAVKYGFDSFNISGISFHFTDTSVFTPEITHRVSPSLTPATRNYGLLIPQMSVKNEETGDSMRLLHKVYQVGAGTRNNRINTWQSGGLASTPTNDKSELQVTMESISSVKVIKANTFAIFQGV